MALGVSDWNQVLMSLKKESKGWTKWVGRAQVGKLVGLDNDSVRWSQYCRSMQPPPSKKTSPTSEDLDSHRQFVSVSFFPNSIFSVGPTTRLEGNIIRSLFVIDDASWRINTNLVILLIT